MSRGSSSFYARLQAAADLLSTGVVVLDRYGRVLWCNTAAEMLIGCSRRNLKGTDIGLLFAHVREWAERFSDKDKKLVPYTAVTELRRPLADPEPVQIMLSSIAESESSVLLEIVPVQNAMDSVRQEQEAGMGEATRSLLRNLAHEVKNPLGGIRGAAQLLEAELEDREQREYTEVIIAEADRLQGLVDRLLQPYRRESHLTEVNLHEVLERVRNLVSVEFGPGLSVLRDYDVSVPAIKGDREQLIQVFLNLMRNAAEAGKALIAEGRAELMIKTRIARQCTIQRKRYRLAVNVHITTTDRASDRRIREKIFYRWSRDTTAVRDWGFPSCRPMWSGTEDRLRSTADRAARISVCFSRWANRSTKQKQEKQRCDRFGLLTMIVPFVGCSKRRSRVHKCHFDCSSRQPTLSKRLNTIRRRCF